VYFASGAVRSKNNEKLSKQKMWAYICFWFEYQEKPLSEIWYPMEYFIERRLRESTKMRLSANIKKGGKGRESIILCLDSQSALPDLL